MLRACYIDIVIDIYMEIYIKELKDIDFFLKVFLRPAAWWAETSSSRRPRRASA